MVSVEGCLGVLRNSCVGSPDIWVLDHAIASESVRGGDMARHAYLAHMVVATVLGGVQRKFSVSGRGSNPGP